MTKVHRIRLMARGFRLLKSIIYFFKQLLLFAIVVTTHIQHDDKLSNGARRYRWMGDIKTHRRWILPCACVNECFNAFSKKMEKPAALCGTELRPECNVGQLYANVTRPGSCSLIISCA